MAWTGRKGEKRHNWTTNTNVADDRTHNLARILIDGCQHLTPAREAEIDARLAHLTEPSTDETEHEPDTKVLAAMNVEETDWMNDEPTEAALLAIENGGL